MVLANFFQPGGVLLRFDNRDVARQVDWQDVATELLGLVLFVVRVGGGFGRGEEGVISASNRQNKTRLFL